MKYRVSWLPLCYSTPSKWCHMEYHTLADAVRAIKILAEMGRNRIALVGVPL